MKKNFRYWKYIFIIAYSAALFLFMYILNKDIYWNNCPKFNTSTSLLRGDTFEKYCIATENKNIIFASNKEMKSPFMNCDQVSPMKIVCTTSNLFQKYILDKNILKENKIQYISIGGDLFYINYDINNVLQKEKIFSLENSEKKIIIKSNYQRSIGMNIIDLYSEDGEKYTFYAYEKYQFNTYDEFIKSNLWGDKSNWNIKNEKGVLKILPPEVKKFFKYKFNRSIPNNFHIKICVRHVNIRSNFDFEIVLNDNVHIVFENNFINIKNQKMKIDKYDRTKIQTIEMEKRDSNILIKFNNSVKMFIGVINAKQTWASFAILLRKGKAHFTEEQKQMRSLEIHSIEIGELL